MSPLVQAVLWFVAAGCVLLAAGGFPLGGPTEMALRAGSLALAFSCMAIGGAIASGRPVAERLGWVPSGVTWPVGLALVLGMLAVSQAAEWVIAWAGYRDVGTLADFREQQAGATGLTLIASLIGLALLPGFGEELAFRGWMQRGFTARLGEARGLLLASALFGAVHGDLVHSPAAFVLGLYLGLVVAWSGSLRPAVLCHVVNNALATLSVALGVHGAALPIFFVGLVAGPWGLWRLWLQRPVARSSLGGTPQPASVDDPFEPSR